MFHLEINLRQVLENNPQVWGNSLEAKKALIAEKIYRNIALNGYVVYSGNLGNFFGKKLFL